jgi:hypothetical protein
MDSGPAPNGASRNDEFKKNDELKKKACRHLTAGFFSARTSSATVFGRNA